MERNLIGLTIVDIRRMTEDELEGQGWDRREHAVVLEFDDGTLIYASQDEEGNGPGALFGTKDGEDFYVLA